MAKKIINKSKIEDQEQVTRDSKFGKNQGIANKNLREAQPTYEVAGSEKIDKGRNNTFIIQGRDRPNTLQSGYGGKGATQAGRIDLIAGLAAAYNHNPGYGSPPNKNTIVNPNFAIDAARVYISQKADIDAYMGLAPVVGQPEGGRSAIGLKADQIRIHSRQDVKIVTGRGKFEGLGANGERLSNGGVNDVTGKISFIAGNYTEDEEYISFSILESHKIGRATKRKLQPLVKGDNLVMCLNDIVDLINQLSQFVGLNTVLIRSLNANFMSHMHPVVGVATGPVNSSLPFSLTAAINNEVNAATRTQFSNGLGMVKNAYLSSTDDPVKGALHINSNFVFTT
jgi:hypothetical protein